MGMPCAQDTDVFDAENSGPVWLTVNNGTEERAPGGGNDPSDTVGTCKTGGRGDRCCEITYMVQFSRMRAAHRAIPTGHTACAGYSSHSTIPKW